MGRKYPDVTLAVRTLIAEASTAPAFNQLALRLMERAERIDDPQSATKWPIFVFETCRALGGPIKEALWAATAVEFATAAAEVVDDLVDDEWSDQAVTQSRVLNASAALIWLAHRAVGRLAGSLGPQRAWLVSDLLTRGYLDACAGEDLDLQFEPMPEVSEEQAYDMTWRKSGSLVAMACQVGAAVATDDPNLLEGIGRFGCHLGLVAQLLNDLAGVDSANTSRGSDLRRRKKTLPVVYALGCAREEGNMPLLAWYRETGRQNADAEQEIASIIHDLGGLHYGWVLADIHRREALTTLEALAKTSGRAEIRRLRRLVPVDRPRPG